MARDLLPVHGAEQPARRAGPGALSPRAGHRSIASTRIYLHLGDGWLADEYKRAAEAIEAQATIGAS